VDIFLLLSLNLSLSLSHLDQKPLQYVPVLETPVVFLENLFAIITRTEYFVDQMRLGKKNRKQDICGVVKNVEFDLTDKRCVVKQV
jgi:hypothetical protein